MGSPLVAAIEQRLRLAKYEVALNVDLSMPLKGKTLRITPAIVASKFYFSWRAFGYVSQNIFVSEVQDARSSDLDILLAVGTHYSETAKSPWSYLNAAEKAAARRASPVPSLVPSTVTVALNALDRFARVKAQGAYIVIPVLITPAPHQDLIAHAIAKPRQRRRLFHMSAVIDSDTGAIYYCRSGGLYGLAALREMRSIISQLIAPKFAQIPQASSGHDSPAPL